MIRFDLYLRRLLYLLFIFFLLLDFSAYAGNQTILLIVSASAFFAGVFFSEVWWGERSLFRERVITGLGIVLASSAAALFSFLPFLFFVPLFAARIGILFSDDSGWKPRVVVFLSAVPPLVAGIGSGPVAFTMYPSAALAASGAAYFSMLYYREQKAVRLETEKNLQTKEAILSTLAHEVRTPLTVIQSTVDILCEGRVGPLNQRQQQFLQSVGSNVRRLVTLSETILASIKVESAWFTISLQPIDIRRVIKDVSVHIRPVLEEKQIELRYSFPQLLSRPPADEGWIHQVLVNLVHNAVKHLRYGGRIIISVNENEQAMVVSVSDNGSGIRLGERAKVFNEFFQGDSWSDEQLDGAGLGLAIVKRVIEKHNGKVYVSSVEHVGTTVSFTLPHNEDKDQ
ncbi:HAMP domain-containing sensor histidine kinase [Marispirochaeta sp.]|uniref:sensor histidine kinase n=1 Tax=Marispirochaeta sp. TaxID=2038653 RepID=UPI0029C6B1D6|nr:HAMP domain-containing sensor histidine kinase [Marispirochaeta sp.]